MSSQALEILRQGVWASATGGWFYDPHQSLFCNTVHLYVWLLLLCLPFTIYLYFPPSVAGWCVYCGTISALFCIVKILNFALHRMYDTSECVVVPPEPSGSGDKRSRTGDGDAEGIEMQNLGAGRSSSARANSDNESVTSIDFHKPDNSTIDLKVDVHRKNSSESSAEEGASLRAVVGAVSVQHAERARQSDPVQTTPGTSSGGGPRQRTQATRRRPGRRSRDGAPVSLTIEELSAEEALQRESRSRTEDAITVMDDDGSEDPPSRASKGSARKGSGVREYFSTEAYLSKFARQLSSDSRDNSEVSINGVQSSPVKKTCSQQYYFNIYPVGCCSKSAITLAQPSSHSGAMRRNSNSTMSAIQLPSVSLVGHTASNSRRHSNAANSNLGFLPTGSVELGAYMMEKGNDDGLGGKSKSNADQRVSGVRRIKSAALEIGCPPPSVSNLSPHPNSVETIGGQVLKNPKSAIIPPPSKSLIRNPHLNLWPKNSSNSAEGSGMPCMNYGSEIVYPIAEISDEMQTSQCQESDLESLSSNCGTDYDEDNAVAVRHHLRGFDSDFNRPPEINSSDTEYENNGSRSPLLDRNECLNDVKIVKSTERCDADHKKQLLSKGLHKNNSFTADSKNCDKNRYDRSKKLLKNNSFNASSTAVAEENSQIVPADVEGDRSENRLFDDGQAIAGKNLRSKFAKNKGSEPGDYFDKMSATSKDFLLEKSSVDSNECLLGNFEKRTDVKKSTELEISNSSGSLEMQDARQETSDISEQKTSDSHSKDVTPKDDSEQKNYSDENSLYGINWLFEESNWQTDSSHNNTNETDSPLECSSSNDKPSCSNIGDNIPKSLGAIPKQIKNTSRTRASSLKENKKKEKAVDCENWNPPTQEELETAEAHNALVHDLECMFAASKSNTVVMPPFNRQERSLKNYTRQTESSADRPKLKKKSIEEMAHTSTSTILPTSMPLLAAFLNSKAEYTNVPLCQTQDVEAGLSCSENCTTEGTNSEIRRYRTLAERNYQRRVRNLKRSNRRRADSSNQVPIKRPKEENTSTDNNTANASTNVHFATSFEDTSDGAIHCFLDEYGNWMSYTFDKNSSGHAKETPKVTQVKPIESQAESSGMIESCGSVGSSLTDDVEVFNKNKHDDTDQIATNGSVCNSPSNEGSNNPLLSGDNNSAPMLRVTSSNSNGFSTIKNRNVYVMDPIEFHRIPNSQIKFFNPTVCIPPELSTSNVLQLVSSTVHSDELESNLNKMKWKLQIENSEFPNDGQPTAYYKFDFFKCFQIKVTVDRLKLMALFDRNLTFKETFLSILLGVLVSVLGALVLHLEFYKDICAFWFCFVIAGSQYSLLKSVQPDSASPIHGFNRMIAFSRPVYFCLYSGLLCLIHFNLMGVEGNGNIDTRADGDLYQLYGMNVDTREILTVTQDVISVFLLFFPLAFSFGLFPQVNTFTMYLLEQTDMHVFGGNATASLSAAFYCVFRSLLAIGVLYGFAFGGLTEIKGSQHILFSIFCGLAVSISYHLSRCASDYTMVWNILKSHMIPSDIYSSSNENSFNIEPTKVSISIQTDKIKQGSDSNISKQQSIDSSISKLNVSSETNVSKSQKRSQTSVNSSVNSLKTDSRTGVNLHSSGSIKMDIPLDESKAESKSKVEDDINEDEMEDPLPKKLQETVNARFKNDVIVCSFMALFIFGIHCTTVFSTLQPELNPVMWSIAGSLGWILHYLVPQLRKQFPWLWLSSPALKAREHAEFEVKKPAEVMWFEKGYVYLCFFERNILYPIIFISAITQDSPRIIDKFGPGWGVLIVCICALKVLRNAYSDPDSQYLILLFAVLLFRLDFKWASETFLIDYFVMSIIFNKTYEFLLKIQFVVTYIAPWQITWGSAFHAFAQPFSVPHSAMLFLQAAVSSILSTPLNPILGSAIFISSYVRPVKFWERDYNTKRVDHSNTRLSSQLERNLGSDDNNLNSIFYEHLTRSLQHYLCGDLLLGRWGQVQQGDCFVLASDYLNCLVHIVEMGNGLVSFQLRGLEFRGTYCQQREVEAISEGPEDNDGCCCCAVGHLPKMLSVNAMFSLRWLAWQLNTARYVLEGYSITDNSAISMLQVFDFRKVLITYYVKSIIFYTIQSPKLEEWLTSSSILEALKPTLDRNFVDLDPIFNLNLDEDYDYRASGITRASFCSVYHTWISHCGMRRDDLYKQKGDKLIARDSPLVSLCFGLSLVGRRTLGTASLNTVSSAELFLYGLHALFKGDFRITCVRDEWVFSDMSLLHSVLAPAVRMALKLHQDHFMSPEEYCNCPALYSAISTHTSYLVICHEASPTWRNNVLRGAPHLLALRHVMDDGADEYKIIMLNKRYLTFRVIKLNRECVRGLWAGQQQELIYLRNRNSERGSIQNAKQALRNIINSSCDQPIGYPIYVSPLTTSYAETNQQLTNLIGGSLTLGVIKKQIIGLWRKIRRRCGEGCLSGSGNNTIECGNNITNTHLSQTPHHTLELSRTSLAGTRGSLASMGKPGSSTLASLAGFLSSREQPLAPATLQATMDLPMSGQKLVFERQDSDPVYSTIRESCEKINITNERECSLHDALRNTNSRRGLPWRQGSSTHYLRDSRQNLSIRDRGRDSARRSKRDRDRDRIRPTSFRLLNTERDTKLPSSEGYEMNSFKGEKSKERHQKDTEKLRESRKEGKSSNSKTVAADSNFLTPESSVEDLASNLNGDNCQIIVNKNINSKHSNSFDQPKESRKRRSSDFACTSNLSNKHHNSEKSIDNLNSMEMALKNIESCSEQSVLRRSGETSRELTKTSKDLRLEREVYRDLAGKYNELSIKETGLRIAGDPKDRKPIVRRSESLKSELKNHVSIGSKVVIVDPAGVYDCINLGRRIDVTWPSAYQRQRGGRNSWGTWVPHQGMDGQVVHKWTPNHRDPNLRSHVDKTILLVQIGDRFVPIAENCVQDLGDEV